MKPNLINELVSLRRKCVAVANGINKTTVYDYFNYDIGRDCQRTFG